MIVFWPLFSNCPLNYTGKDNWYFSDGCLLYCENSYQRFSKKYSQFFGPLFFMKNGG